MITFKSGWRPAFGWCYAFVWTLCGAVVAGRILFGLTTITEATPLLMALLAGGAAPVTTYTYGRTQEKREGVTEPTDFPPPDFDMTTAPPVADERGGV